MIPVIGLHLTCTLCAAGTLASPGPGITASTNVTISLVSKAAVPEPVSDGDSTDVHLNADGRWAVFVSSASGLATNDTNEKIDVFLCDLQSRSSKLISRSTNGASASGDSLSPRVSADGRFVVFDSDAPDLAPGDRNGAFDVFLYDRESAEITLISQTAGTGANGEARLSAITPDARFILFESSASDLTPNDANEAIDLFLFDRSTGERRLVTADWKGEATVLHATPESKPDFGSLEGSLSDDGRLVAFVSGGSNVVENASQDRRIYLWSSLSGTSQLVLTNGVLAHQSPGLTANLRVSPGGDYLASRSVLYQMNAGSNLFQYPQFSSYKPSGFSSNDLFVVFSSSTSDFKNPEIYQINTSNQVARLIAAAPRGFDFSLPLVSADGQTIAFTSNATNLTSDPASSCSQLFVFHAATGTIDRLSHAPGAPVGADQEVYFPALSGDGRVAAFSSAATNLVPGKTDPFAGIFTVATSGGQVSRITLTVLTTESATGNGASILPSEALSLDGHYLVFLSLADNLVTNDTNGTWDIFLRDIWDSRTKLISRTPEGGQFTRFLEFHSMSANGRTILFSGFRVVNDESRLDLFAYDIPSGAVSLVNILEDGQRTNFASPSMSADGRYVGFWSRPNGLVRDLWTGITKPLAASFPDVPVISSSGRFALAIERMGWSVHGLIERDSGILFGHDFFSLPDPYYSRLLGSPFTLDDRWVLLAHSPEAGLEDLFLYSIASGESNRVGANFEGPATVSPDGSAVLYQRATTNSANLKAFETVLFDKKTEASTILAFASEPVRFRHAQFSVDGRFLTLAVTNALPNAISPRPFMDILSYDRVLQRFTLISHVDGIEAAAPSGRPSIASNGRVVAFVSSASNLVSDDQNRASDVFIARIAPVDENGNGLEDGWETAHFGGEANPDADTDSDGISNLDEYLAGTDPRDRLSGFTFAANPRVQDGALILEFRGVPGKS